MLNRLDFTQQYSSLPTFNITDDEFKKKDLMNSLLGQGNYSVPDPTEDMPNSTPVPMQLPDPTQDIENKPALAQNNQVMGPADEFAPQNQPQVNRAPAVMQQPPNTSDAVKQAIAQKYGYGSDLDSDALKNAQNQQSQNTLFANLGEAASDFGNALGRSTKPTDNSFYQGLRKQANEPVQNILEQRKAKLEDVAAQRDMENNDPNSTKAQIMRKMYEPLATKVKLDPSILKQMSVRDLKDFAAGPLEYAAKLQSHSDDVKYRNEYLKSASLDRQAKQRDTADAKVTSDQGKADSELGTKEPSIVTRGANKNYAEALRRGQNIKDLLNRYPDLDKMPQQQADLLTEEIDGLINGGAPSVTGTHTLGLKTAQSGFNKMLSFFGGKPRPADLGAFIKENVPYINGVIDNSKKHLYGERKNLVESYGSRLSPDAKARHMEALEEEYGSGVGKNESSAKGAHAPGSTVIYKGKQYRVGQDGDSLEPL